MKLLSHIGKEKKVASMNDTVVEVVDVDFTVHGNQQQKTSLPQTIMQNSIHILIQAVSYVV
jgi:hypothetical protein